MPLNPINQPTNPNIFEDKTCHEICDLYNLFATLLLNEIESIRLYVRFTIISTQLNGFTYCDLTLILLFNINNIL